MRLMSAQSESCPDAQAEQIPAGTAPGWGDDDFVPFLEGHWGWWHGLALMRDEKRPQAMSIAALCFARPDVNCPGLQERARNERRYCKASVWEEALCFPSSDTGGSLVFLALIRGIGRFVLGYISPCKGHDWLQG